jgi:hypothetical protein
MEAAQPVITTRCRITLKGLVSLTSVIPNGINPRYDSTLGLFGRARPVPLYVADRGWYVEQWEDEKMKIRGLIQVITMNGTRRRVF